MQTRHLPFIEAANYEAFVTLIPQLPASFATWQELRTELIQEQMILGPDPAEVKVRPDMFERWCRDRGRTPSLDSLLVFASEEGAPPEQGSHIGGGTTTAWGAETDGKA